MSSPHPPVPRDPDTSDAVLTPRKTIWLIGIALFASALLWAALYQVKSTAEDNAPTPAETAQCIAALDPASQVDIDEACPTGADVKWAARHPLRNSTVVFVLLLVAGSITFLIDRNLRRANPGARR